MIEMNQIIVLLERVARFVNTELYRDGLKPTQWEALRYLARANRFSRNLGALTQYIGITKGTVSQTVQALERKDLLSKNEGVFDRRIVMLELTDKGWNLLQNDPFSQMKEGLKKLSKQDRQLLYKGLNIYLTMLLKENSNRSFGECRTCCHCQIKSDTHGVYFCDLFNEKLDAEDVKLICLKHEI